MSLQELHQSQTRERTQNGTVTSITYVGSQAECLYEIENAQINTTFEGVGRLESVTMGQLGATLYTVTYKWTTAGYSAGEGGGEVTPPPTVVGEKSYSLDATMLSSPLEQHPSYLKKWNYGLAKKYLLANKPSTIPSTPTWYDTSTATTSIPLVDQGDYRWFQSESELPIEQGYIWIVLALPTLAGFSSYDEPSYTLTMTERQRSYTASETIAAAKINKIFTNSQVGSSFSGGNWKCDRATTSWNNEYWILTLTFTYSPRGWNTTLYSTYTGNI